jgi:hypothetical protein
MTLDDFLAVLAQVSGLLFIVSSMCWRDENSKRKTP